MELVSEALPVHAGTVHAAASTDGAEHTSYEFVGLNDPAFCINPLNAELNPIRHLLALVGARHVVHVSRIRVNHSVFH